MSETENLLPGLYLVATPIGNLRDITLRALDVLRKTDLILCEDTRITAKLCHAYDIATPRRAYHEYNAAKIRPQILAELTEGRSIALVSDAGTPLVSDPGYKLVVEALAAGVAVHPLPGASAPLAGLLLSGLPSDRFCFAGFMPVKTKARQRELVTLKDIPATLIFFETAPRLADSLADMRAVLGDRPACVARELTKLYEEARRGLLSELVTHYRESGSPRGEIVIVVGAPVKLARIVSDAEIDAALAKCLPIMRLKEAAAEVAATLKLPRKQVYTRALALKGCRDQR